MGVHIDTPRSILPAAGQAGLVLCHRHLRSSPVMRLSSHDRPDGPVRLPGIHRRTHRLCTGRGVLPGPAEVHQVAITAFAGRIHNVRQPAPKR